MRDGLRDIFEMVQETSDGLSLGETAKRVVAQGMERSSRIRTELEGDWGKKLAAHTFPERSPTSVLNVP